MTSGMEPEVRRYLKKVLYSLFAGLFWLFFNSMAGIYFGLGLRNGKTSVVNIIFYCWLLLSLGLLIWYYYRTWRR